MLGAVVGLSLHHPNLMQAAAAALLWFPALQVKLLA